MKIKRQQKKRPKKNNKDKEYSAEDYIEQGNAALADLDLDLARNCFNAALQVSPADTNIMDALADVLIQLGDIDAALTLLSSSTSLAPTENPLKWFFYAQLQCGIEAVESYRKGISVSSDKIEICDSEEKVQLVKQVAKAHSSIADLYMTDLCYEEDAETICEKEILSALSIDPNSLDAKQTYASFKLSQNKPAEASKIIDEVYARIMDIRNKIQARSIADEIRNVNNNNEEASSEIIDNPDLEFCISTVKILIECHKHDPNLCTKAIQLSISLLQEDDETIELWYLIGVAALSCSPPDHETAKYHLDHAMELLTLIKKECKKQREEFPFQEQYQLVLDHLKMIDMKAIAAINNDNEDNISNNNNSNSNNEKLLVDEEWSDVDEEEEEDEMNVDH